MPAHHDQVAGGKVSDIEAARASLVDRGAEPSEVFRFEDDQEVPGPDPQRGDDGSFLSLSDPDGTGWLVQELGRHRDA